MALGQKTNVFIGFLLLIVLFVGFWMLLTFIAEFLASQDIKFVVAATALTGAAIGAWIKSYLEGRHSVEEHFRQRKADVYHQLISRVAMVFHKVTDDKEIDSDDLVTFFRKWQSDLILWGGPKVLNAYLDWRNNINTNARGTVLTYGDLLLAMRKDLKLSNRGITHDIAAHWMLKDADLFLKLVAEYPDITMDEIVAYEESQKRRGNPENE